MAWTLSKSRGYRKLGNEGVIMGPKFFFLKRGGDLGEGLEVGVKIETGEKKGVKKDQLKLMREEREEVWG